MKALASLREEIPSLGSSLALINPSKAIVPSAKRHHLLQKGTTPTLPPKAPVNTTQRKSSELLGGGQGKDNKESVGEGTSHNKQNQQEQSNSHPV